MYSYTQVEPILETILESEGIPENVEVNQRTD